MWPKPMPNHWLLGSATGVAIDSRDHVYVIHLTDSFTARTETGSGPRTTTSRRPASAARSAPNVLEFDPAGSLVEQLGWTRPGLRVADAERRHRNRSGRATSGSAAWAVPTPAS